MPLFSPHQLTAISQDVFVAAGLERDEAGIVAEHLIQANLAGHDSHGVLRIPEYIEWMEAGDVVPGQHMTIMHETDVLAVIEGGWGFGQVIGLEAIQVAMDKAQKTASASLPSASAGTSGVSDTTLTWRRSRGW